ncbi:3,4-dihydroxy-2-butanone 4-phosphate synthase [Moraxella bovoculi]|uniref:bifunctional 3,4-dihydroxy-2-butanone-4-phosphate synthase/GTP cyclohydrolase II n=1 Tax=Moraxella bovoculi TaxID=386891 RepID=UPI00062441D6|nr:bifunctional 3,4-dihydroxy-2-butanone-4-phosphate synthase/GTP cyclohydrolase II [Moraxella bovoculi]AKG19656.1 3,4-dihydroxy-2-butanone 4-phosphate synthase [Moraxella bovoculi]NSM11467.1 bifunctional 3,4-dihydroxy-2-butanone-4-phosphate synthase/GTP cyclohydrolase II [Moraxella bovoculi]
MALNTAQEIIEDIKAGKMVILMDDEDRENEGDIVMAATHVRAEDINFMIKYARGLVCLTLSEERCKQLELPLMSDKNGAKFSTNFTLSIEAAEGVTTGISAADRARTIQAAVAPFAKPSDIVQPGHIFPIMAKKGGVLHRAGHTEAGCDLARLAGLEPAAVICEIIKEDGEMARRADLEVFAAEHGLKIGTIADLIHYRMTNEQTVELIDSREFDSEFGQFTLHRFQEYGASEIHIALTKGEPSEGVATVRVHSLNPLRDLLGASDSTTGKSGWDIRAALKEIGQSDRGVFVWIDNGAPVDLSDALDKCKANNSIHEAQEPYRSIGVGAQILRLLDVRDMRLLSSPAKFNVSGFDLNIVESVSAPK